MTPPRAVVLDMEGVLHVDWQPIDGSAAAVERLTAAGVGLAVLTNTTGRTRAEIAARLAEMGMPIPAGRIVTAASAAAEHLRRHHAGARVYALVEPALAGELEGVELVDDPAAAEVMLHELDVRVNLARFALGDLLGDKAALAAEGQVCYHEYRNFHAGIASAKP